MESFAKLMSAIVWAVIGRISQPESDFWVYKGLNFGRTVIQKLLWLAITTMESFAKLMSAIGTSGVEHDLVEILPVEITEIIFRQLDPRSLLNVARVSTKWMNVCRHDCKIRRTVRHHLRNERTRMLDLDTSLPKPPKNKMTKPAKVHPIPNRPFTSTPASFSFKSSSGPAPRQLTGPKRLGNRSSKAAPSRITTRLR
ncbi:hypothetical protein PV328_000723 [Microctonus aethiopoides]|uniref:F-box domain-containing protein n=1 Tax=Microctonus aethiopoides TaxID=144406 RepID=A0AA39KWR1_9HYME|nr:hypothetical protein PV328_000723 [Microctonus aethiopoides]